MATRIVMPKLGLTMKEGIVTRWFKNEGDPVRIGEPVVEVMTKKITYKIESAAEGALLKVVAPKGKTLPIGGLLGVIGSPDENISDLLMPAPESPAASVTAGAAPSREAVKISPAARKLAEENGVDYARLVGTGPEGRITREDVQKAIAQGVGPAKEPFPADERPVLKVLPYEGMRKAIGDHMSRSWAVAPKVTHHVEVEISALLALRGSVNSDLKEKDKVSLTDFLVKAAARALEMRPEVNSTLEGEEIKVLRDINIGVAIALENGLIVPVLKNANQKSLSAVSQELKKLVKRAKRNKLEPDEMAGGTFTITNVGAYGSVDWFTPIINQPESAVLGVGRVVEKPVVVDGQIAIRPTMGLSLSFDHRVIDGGPAAEFLAVLIGLIEKPHKIYI